MTTEQLMRIARRINLSIPGMRLSDLEYWCKDVLFGYAVDVDMTTAAILREEMGLAGELQTDWKYSSGVVQYDDPTQTIVIDV